MKGEKPTILDRKKKNKAGEKRTILEDYIEIREICTDLNFEIDIPDSVLAALNVNPEKDMGSLKYGVTSQSELDIPLSFNVCF